MDTVKPWVSGAAFSVVVAVVYVACAVAVLIFPDGTLSFLNAWTHGIDLSMIKRPAGQPVVPGDWVTGFLTAVIAAFFAGTLYGWSRNLFLRIAS